MQVPPQDELSLGREVQSQHDAALLVVPPLVPDYCLLAVEVQTGEVLLEAFLHIIAVVLPVELRQEYVHPLPLQLFSLEP